MKIYPVTVTVMMLCYYSSNPAGEFKDRWHTASWCAARTKLFEEGMIDGDGKATEKGKAWVNAVCNVPLPVAQWVIPS